MLILLAACLRHEELPLNQDAIVGVGDPALARLLSDHWEHTLAASPLFATRQGDHRFDDRLPDVSDAAWKREMEFGRQILARADALGSLEGADGLTLEIFRQQLRDDLGAADCRMHLWTVSPRDNPLVNYGDLLEIHTGSEASLRARYRALPGLVQATIGNLEAGALRGWFANEQSVRRVIAQADELLATPTTEWTLYKPGFEEEIEAIRAAFVDYRDFLALALLPNARTGAPGLVGMPGGKACYAALVRQNTTLDLDPVQIHAKGLAELEAIHAELAELGEKALGVRAISEIGARLRGDRALHFTDAAEVQAAADAALRRAEAAVPTIFGRLPRASCEVRPIPEVEAPWTTIAYYRQPGDDRVGVYFINTYKPETRPRYEAEVLAFHESVPGHHLQIAIQQELPAMPAFRRHAGQNVYVEGWALYTERVCDELGLYSSDLDRLGMLGFDAWRASRLVVDTGLHHLGWSRDQAVDFMRQNTILAENNIDNEVDRYIVWPGQALGYKTGQVVIRELRADAEAALGERFVLSRFHDVVLGVGAVPMPVLQARVRAWIAEGGP